VRKPRDIDAELRTLQDKAKSLKARKVLQLGELVTATGADALDAETLAGLLLEAVEQQKSETREGWRRRGAAFFQRRARSPKNAGEPSGDDAGAATDGGGHGAR
jgi:ribosomal 50S subunit-associated protein YjgA (DUF615 family)